MAVSAEPFTTLGQLMGSLDDLPADQRAVLQMVVQRGRSYDDIAAVLSIDRAAVRQRALDACDALTPVGVEPGPERALVTDYLLGQLPEPVADQVYAYLEAADADREWAAAIADRLAPLSPRALADIPAASPVAADEPYLPYDDAYPAEYGGEVAEPDDESDDHTYTPLPRDWASPAAGSTAAESHAPAGARRAAPAAAPPGGRGRGSLWAGGVLVLAVVVFIVVLLTNGGSSPSGRSSKTATNPPATTTTQTSTTTTTKTGTTTTGTTTTGTQPLAQLNLTSPVGATQTIGIVQVIRSEGIVGIVILAQGVPPNAADNAYAIWLYNSPTSYKFVGFVRNLVGKSGRLAAEGELPAHAARYHHLLVTLETQQSPSKPGEVVLSGPFRESQ